MRTVILVLLVLVVVAGAVYFGSQRLLVQPAAEPTPSSLQAGPVRAEVVQCRGRVVPARWQALSFAGAGQVARVAVEEGAAVAQGDLLAELKGEDFALEIRAAEERLLLAQAELAAAQAAPAPEKLQAARAQAAAAQAALDALRATPTAIELEEARLRVDQARNALWGAQAARDSTGGSPYAGAALDEARARVASAEVAVRLAELDYERVKAGPGPEAIAAAEADLARARESLAALQAGATAEDLAVLRAAVGQAEVGLEQVRASQAKAAEEGQLRAPFGGVVTSIAVREGQHVAPGQEALVIADLSELQVETVDLGELDIAAVRPEQPVGILIPGAGTPVLGGRVTFISSQATFSPSGEARYRVVISLDRQEPTLRWGMTANLGFGGRIR